MPKVTPIRTPGQDELPKTVLDLLKSSVFAGHSVSIYTSKKERLWFCIRTWNPRPVTSAAELLPDAPHEQWDLAVTIAVMDHMHKLRGEWVMENSWVNLEAQRKVQDGYQALMARWLAGGWEAVFEEGEIPLPQHTQTAIAGPLAAEPE